ncbi:alpha/beta fold hydrolase [Amycolatopsis albispora]|uniref:Hydrolase n=1 Tax=Amycolatopsis albispora TaxID=1804986 RepID=A0A344L440_9PSEU|nr:alpha/beta hydrolase [Amycolatopsis albispora]AXB42814.1 hydrolase [Amycolatopsis albispora]
MLNGSLSRPGAVIRYGCSPGRGPAVVFTHGAGMSHEAFAAQAAALPERQVVCWDLRGHGESVLEPGTRFTAEDALADLAALLDHLELERPVLVGHSLGGNLSQALVRRAPARAGGLVVLGSTWNAGPLTGTERRLLRLAAPALAMVPEARLPRLMAKASAVTPEAIAATEAVFARMPKRVFLDVWRATASLVEPDPDYRTPVPLTLIRGERDRTGNIATAMPRWAAAEGVSEHVVPGAGHVVMLDAPAEIAVLLGEQLAAM